jgi:BirA family biotin operon repressor/biotin-[acetyl-CoA-carboxylase] ligase
MTSFPDMPCPMKRLDCVNAFGGPVYFEERVSSTMDVSRRLAAGGAPQGTVITADFQEAGRGRTGGRSWLGDPGDNLFFTILLHYSSFAALPAALSLRTGLAVSLAIEDLAPPLAGLVRIKWPNDVLILLPPGGRKIAGILCEAGGGALFIGVGVNLWQKGFPPELKSKATSLSLSLGELGKPAPAGPGDLRFTLLELILDRLYRELEAPGGPESGQGEGGAWRGRLEERLYMKGRRVRFIAGGADTGKPVEGLLRGVGPGGELLLLLPGEGERAFITGELDLYG